MSRHADSPDLLNEFDAADFLGVSVSPIRRMMAVGAIEGVPMELGKKPNYHFRRADLEARRPCLQTAAQLEENGFADPVDGHLWVLKKISPVPAEGPHYDVTDLGNCGRIYHSKRAARKARMPWTSLKAAFTAWEKYRRGIPADASVMLPGFRIYGGHWILVFESDLLTFGEALKPAKGVDFEKFKRMGELTAIVGAVTKNQIHEAAQQIHLWRELGWLSAMSVICKTPGAVPKNWSGAATGKGKRLRKRAIEKRCRRDVYDVTEFKKLWAKDQRPDIDETRKLIGDEGVPIRALRAEHKKRGIGDLRSKRFARLAGATSEWRKVGALRTMYYVKTHTGAAPLRRRTSFGTVKRWLAKELKNGPRSGAELIEAGRTNEFERGAIRRAARELECTKDVVMANPGEGKGKMGFQPGHGGRHVFWRLPDHPRLTEKAARTIIEERRKAAAAPIGDADHRQPRPAQNDPPKKGGRPASEQSPSKQKQRWCYEQYMDFGKKPSQIVVLSKAVFGKNAPKSEGDIINYARRWAAFKNLPIPKRT